jgi:hypothetical protein
MREEDFDVPGADWIDVRLMGSDFEEQMDKSRASGQWRHRRRATGNEPLLPWKRGRAPEGRTTANARQRRS